MCANEAAHGFRTPTLRGGGRLMRYGMPRRSGSFGGTVWTRGWNLIGVDPDRNLAYHSQSNNTLGGPYRNVQRDDRSYAQTLQSRRATR